MISFVDLLKFKAKSVLVNIVVGLGLVVAFIIFLAIFACLFYTCLSCKDCCCSSSYKYTPSSTSVSTSKPSNEIKNDTSLNTTTSTIQSSPPSYASVTHLNTTKIIIDGKELNMTNDELRRASREMLQLFERKVRPTFETIKKRYEHINYTQPEKQLEAFKHDMSYADQLELGYREKLDDKLEAKQIMLDEITSFKNRMSSVERLIELAIDDKRLKAESAEISKRMTESRNTFTLSSANNESLIDLN